MSSHSGQSRLILFNQAALVGKYLCISIDCRYGKMVNQIILIAYALRLPRGPEASDVAAVLVAYSAPERKCSLRGSAFSGQSVVWSGLGVGCAAHEPVAKLEPEAKTALEQVANFGVKLRVGEVLGEERDRWLLTLADVELVGMFAFIPVDVEPGLIGRQICWMDAATVKAATERPYRPFPFNTQIQMYWMGGRRGVASRRP